MADIALVLSTDGLSADLGIAGGDLVTDDGLDTAVLISLFTDRRADTGDKVDRLSWGGDRRGWPGDLLGLPGDRIGSRLWELQRATLPTNYGQPTAPLVQQFAAEALSWMVEDGVAASVTPNASELPPSPAIGVAEAVQLVNAIKRGTRPLGKWKFVWDAQAAKGD